MKELHYIDTFYLAPFYLPEPASEVVEDRLLSLPPGSIIISPLVRAEFASLLARKCRMGEMKEAHARRVMRALDTHLLENAIGLVPVQSEDFDQAVTWIMAMTHPLRAPDALHLAIAARVGAVFWTLDSRLEQAARWVGLEVGE